MLTLAPFGMRPLFHPTGLDRAHRYLNAIPSGHAFNLYKFAPVIIAADGTIQPAANGGDFKGIWGGIQYPDAFGRPTFVNNWISGTVLGTGPVWAFVWDAEDVVYEAQANGSITEAMIGDQLNFSAVAGETPTSGSNLTGLSTMALNATPVGVGNQGMVRIYDVQPRPDNDWGDLFTIVQVQIARDQYVANKVAI